MNTTPTEGTLQFIAGQIAQRPGVKHSALVLGDRDTQARRRSALLILQERGMVVRSKQTPYRYWLAAQLQKPQETKHDAQ